MQTNAFGKAAILTLVLVLLFIAGWEMYWRNKGFTPTFNDDEKLWAYKRKDIYQPAEKTTVFIGSSRIKFDLDLPTWRNLTGDEPVQLSIVGTSPRPLLEDLANDEKFNGKVVIDVTEPLFFSRHRYRTEESALKGIKYYKDETPSQKVSDALNRQLEGNLVFLEEAKFSMNELLSEAPLPQRKGVFHFPIFPKEFELSTLDRQTFMSPQFEKSKEMQAWQIENWKKLGALSKTPALKGDSLIMIFDEVKKNIDKIRQRGGKVIFVRTPSSGGYWETESTVYPRKDYWDAMLSYTNTPGIHFKDYPAMANFICPEWSHLSSGDALLFTREFIAVLKQKGWQFPNKPAIAYSSFKKQSHAF